MKSVSGVNLNRLFTALKGLSVEEQSPRKEIFLRSFDLFGKFYTDFGADVKDFQAVAVIGNRYANIEDTLDAIEDILVDVIRMIRSLIENLDQMNNKQEVIFWND